jgi:hypothetical protein
MVASNFCPEMKFQSFSERIRSEQVGVSTGNDGSSKAGGSRGNDGSTQVGASTGNDRSTTGD